MDHQFGGWSSVMVPTPNPTAQGQLQQQQQQFQLQRQQQFHMQQQQQQKQFQMHQPQHPSPQQQQQQQSLASHFQIIDLIESLAEALQGGARDQNLDAVVNELTNRFDKCQKLLNTISLSLDNKGVTVQGQKHKLEEAEQLLNQRRELVAKYRSSVEDLLNSDCNI